MKRVTAREIAVRLGFFASTGECPVSEAIDVFFDKEYYETLAEVDELFAEYPDDKQMEYIRRLTGLMEDYRIQIDRYIEKYASGWKLSRISKTALAVLRCAVCEIMYMDDIPNGAAINEAVELAKGYDEPETVAFVNGILGGFVRGELSEARELPETEK
ncbi:MAG: transcription antitermination factor NusB [Oscillospiraceae bacterium]|nr:transcription antitermination factor NusB [Oscillospiraceae bacterium]